MKSKKIFAAVTVILLIVTLAFIWTNSLQSIPESQTRSLGVMKMVRPFLEIFVGKGNVTDHLVRKLAHFIEFGALGCELALLSVLRGRVRRQPVIYCAFAGMLVALTDETIQIFTGRGSQVQDVWLDFAGACSGILSVCIIADLVKATCRRKDERRKS